jgi:hypothetical protein
MRYVEVFRADSSSAFPLRLTGQKHLCKECHFGIVCRVAGMPMGPSAILEVLQAVLSLAASDRAPLAPALGLCAATR